MVFDSFGRWMPNTQQVIGPSPAQGANFNTMAPNMLTQQVQQASQPSFNPNLAQTASSFQSAPPMAFMPSQQVAPLYQPPTPQAQMPAQPQFNPQMYFRPQQPIQQVPQPIMTRPVLPQVNPQSIEQSVNNGSPQSVQNFLTALNKVGAGSNNNFMTAPGTQGQGPQAGFQGFQQNGTHAPGVQWQGYGGQAPVQLGSYANQASNMANFGGNGMSAGSGVSQGGTGGMQGQPGNTNYSNGTYSQPGPGPMANASFVPPPAGNVSGPPPQMSDQTAKQDIQSGQAELQDFLNNLGVYSYEYKDPKYGEGRRISPMAQEIEQSPLGAQAIVTNPEGYKMVDYGKLAGVQLAALALLNHKYSELEKKLTQAISKKFSKG